MDMKNSSLSRGIALMVGGLAIVGTGFTVGCSAKQSPSPTEQTENPVESKRATQNDQNDPGENAPNTDAPRSFAPSVTADPAPTIEPGGD